MSDIKYILVWGVDSHIEAGVYGNESNLLYDYHRLTHTYGNLGRPFHIYRVAEELEIESLLKPKPGETQEGGDKK